MAWGLLLQLSSQAGPPPSPAGAILTIDGSERRMLNGWNLRRAVNARGTLMCDIVSMNGAYRPALDDEVILTDNGVLIFGGLISNTRESGVGPDVWPHIKTAVTAVDYNSIAEHRHVDGTIVTGTLKSVLTAIVSILGVGTGVTLHGSQADGPTIPELIYSDARLDSVLNDLTVMSGGWPWEIDENKALRMYQPGTIAAPFDILATNSEAVGDIEVEPSKEGYANTVIVKSANFRVFSVDAAEVTLRTPWEAIYVAPDETPEAAMQAMSDDILARSTPIVERASYKTITPGLKPGQTQTIDVAQRNLNNTFLITEIDLRQWQDDVHFYHVTAVEGLVYQTDWREMYRRWGGSGTVAGGVTIGGGGGGGGTSTHRVYFLGGNGIEATRSPTPTWVPASGGGAIGQGAVHVQIDTVALGTTTATVKARLRALDAGVSVQARLYDATTPAACPGVSSVVTSTAWVFVAFTVTLTAGNHFYELQLLPGTANADVLGVGYVEGG